MESPRESPTDPYPETLNRNEPRPRFVDFDLPIQTKFQTDQIVA